MSRSNSLLLYRARKLEDLGWIRIHRPGNESGGVSPPNHYLLVREKVSEYLDAKPDIDDLTLDERLQRLEGKIETLDGGVDDDVTQLKTDVAAIKSYLLEELNITEPDLMKHHRGD